MELRSSSTGLDAEPQQLHRAPAKVQGLGLRIESSGFRIPV